jgi:hypothetical protein
MAPSAGDRAEDDVDDEEAEQGDADPGQRPAHGHGDRHAGQQRTFYGAGTGARMISADEDTGDLDLLLAHPISRTRLLLHRYAALPPALSSSPP